MRDNIRLRGERVGKFIGVEGVTGARIRQDRTKTEQIGVEHALLNGLRAVLNRSRKYAKS